MSGSHQDRFQEERSLTARPENDDWIYHYRNYVPFADFYRKFILHAFGQVQLALGQDFTAWVIALTLKQLVVSIPEDAERTAAIQRRISAGDLSLLCERDLFNWEDISSDFASLFAFALYGTNSSPDPVVAPERSGRSGC